jgi:hypothetical protein
VELSLSQKSAVLHWEIVCGRDLRDKQPQWEK